YWKGNVRELRNVMERAVLFCEGDLLAGVELAPGSKLQAPAGVGLKDLSRGPISLEQEVAALERAYIDQAMKLADGNYSRAAELLGCTRFTLKRRLEQSNAVL
ncbi:MAG: helix-turn-helix domain-containing protein, partial [Pygmaiobacter massiliensis]